MVEPTALPATSRRPRPRSGRLLALLLVLAPLPADAQPPLAAPTAAPTPPAEVSPESPRSALAEFFRLCNDGKYGEAAAFLDLPPSLSGRGPQTARQLKAVLDRHLWIDLEKVSLLPLGRQDDGLPPEYEEVGTIPGRAGRHEPVRMRRREAASGAAWVFTSSTVQRVPSWFADLGHAFLRKNLPDVLFRMGPRGLLRWQWLAIVVLLPVLLGAGRVLGWATRRLLLVLAARTRTSWDDAILGRLTGPLSLGWALVLGLLALPLLRTNEAGADFVRGMTKAGAVVTLFWALLRSVKVASEVAAETEWGRTHPNAKSVLGFGTRFAELTIVLMAFVASLSAFGVNVASILAGVGIGGIAIALAAQKTVENLFGAVSIGVDQPMQVGDYVKVDLVQGTVEEIGLRSTRIRTLDRTLVTIPNGKLADREIETFAARDRFRFVQPVGLVYGTTAAQVRQVLAGIESLLRAHPKIWPDVVVARLAAFGASSLDLEVMAWFQTTDMEEFRKIREEVLLGILEVVETAGTGLAFPTRTLHVVPAPSRTGAGALSGD